MSCMFLPCHPICLKQHWLCLRCCWCWWPWWWGWWCWQQQRWSTSEMLSIVQPERLGEHRQTVQSLQRAPLDHIHHHCDHIYRHLIIFIITNIALSSFGFSSYRSSIHNATPGPRAIFYNTLPQEGGSVSDNISPGDHIMWYRPCCQWIPRHTSLQCNEYWQY